MRKKLEVFLKECGFEIKYHNLYTRENYGGRSFYNDGTYKEEAYKITRGKECYIICDKVTGRPHFMLTDRGDNPLVNDFSQTAFIEQLKKFFKIS